MNGVRKFLDALRKAKVHFVVIGGVAASAHGSAYLTFDLDISYERSLDNLNRLARALEAFRPRLRGTPRNLPFRLDARTLSHGMNFTLATDAGDLDLFGEVQGIGIYERVKALAQTLPLFGVPCAVLSVEGLIASKRAAGRTKDLLVLPELEALRELEARTLIKAVPSTGRSTAKRPRKPRQRLPSRQKT